MHIQDKDTANRSRTGQRSLNGQKRIRQPENKAANMKKARRKQTIHCLVYFALIGLCCFCIWRMEAGRDRSHEKPNPPRQIILMEQEPDEDRRQDVDTELSFAAGEITLDSLHSTYALLIDAETGQVLAQKNSEDRMYPASMTKLMAALVAVEHTEDWNATVEIPYEIFSRLYIEHASLAGFEPEEKVMPKELLYGMLLSSGAECCNAYAMWLAGDEDTFVEWMNLKAAELGMENTHFTNTTGLHNEEHYSTAEDMATLLYQCIQDETIRSVLKTETYQTAATAKHPQGLTLESTLFQTINESKALTKKLKTIQAKGVMLLGGKTGYTSQAGMCLASFASVGGREYILITAGAEGNHYTEHFHIEDTLAVYSQIAASVE